MAYCDIICEVMKNPFKFGQEVSGYQFYDRKQVTKELRQKMVDGSSNVVLFAPRRYGKTSLVVRVLEELSVKDGIKGLCFDMTRVTNLGRFCEAYVNAVYAMTGGRKELMHKLADYLASFRPELTVTVAGVVRIRLDVAAALNEMSIVEALDLPEKLAEDLGAGPFVVAFDEFQEVANLSKEFALEKIFRSCIQAHRHVRYVFFGSKTHLMKRMFADASRPFYNSAMPLPLGKPPIDESREFLSSRFREAGVVIGDEEVEEILAVSENIPYYLQELASVAFEERTAQNAVDAKVLSSAIDGIVAKNSELYAERLSGLSGAQRDVLGALADEPAVQFTEDYRHIHALPGLSTIHTAVRGLQEAGIVDTTSEGTRIADPFFARFIRSSAARVF